MVLEEAGKLNYRATLSRRGRNPKGILRVGVAEMLTPAQQLEAPYDLCLSGYVRQGCLDKKYACLPLESRGEIILPPEGERPFCSGRLLYASAVKRTAIREESRSRRRHDLCRHGKNACCGQGKKPGV